MKNILTPSKHLVSPHDQNADFVELFFDLVFVYAITRLTAVTAHHLDIKHVLQSLIILWMIWWGWSLFTTALNSANTKIAEVRLGVLITTAIAFIMAANVEDAFSANPMAFAIAYICVRTIGVGLYVRVTSSLKKTKTATFIFSIFSIITFTLILIGAGNNPEERIWWWLGAIIIDIIGMAIGSQFDEWEIHPLHYAERHGLIIIIALGESLIVAASALSQQSPTPGLILLGGLSVIITCLAWWSYFGWTIEHLEHHFKKTSKETNVRIARDVYTLLHFIIIAGIISFAVSFELILAHPEEVLSSSVAYSLCAGFLLFIGATGFSVWRVSKIILVPRIILTIVSIAGILISIGKAPQQALYIILGSLALMCIVEWKRCRHL